VWLSLDTTFDAGSDVRSRPQNHGGALLGAARHRVREYPSATGWCRVTITSWCAAIPTTPTGDVDLSNNFACSADTVHFSNIPVDPDAPPGNPLPAAEHHLSIINMAVTGTDITGASVPNAGVAGQPLHVDWTARKRPGDIQGQSWSPRVLPVAGHAARRLRLHARSVAGAATLAAA